MDSELLRVLIVEDSPDDVEALCHAFDQRGAYVIRVVESVSDGVAVAKEFLPDVVILDLRLPDSTAQQTVSAIPLFAKECAVIVYSALNGRYRKGALEGGALDFIAKNSDSPFKIAAVVRLSVVKWRRRQTERLMRQEITSARTATESALRRLIGAPECPQQNG